MARRRIWMDKKGHWWVDCPNVDYLDKGERRLGNCMECWLYGGWFLGGVECAYENENVDVEGRLETVLEGEET